MLNKKTYIDNDKNNNGDIKNKINNVRCKNNQHL